MWPEKRARAIISVGEYYRLYGTLEDEDERSGSSVAIANLHHRETANALTGINCK
jgi:hypothetical protein